MPAYQTRHHIDGLLKTYFETEEGEKDEFSVVIKNRGTVWLCTWRNSNDTAPSSQSERTGNECKPYGAVYILRYRIYQFCNGKSARSSFIRLFGSNQGKTLNRERSLIANYRSTSVGVGYETLRLVMFWHFN